MERMLVIGLAVSIGAAFYGWCDWMLRKETVRDFIKREPWLHPNSICYWRTIIAWIGFGLYFIVNYQDTGIIVFTFAAVLDGVDGLVARRCSLVSVRGEWLDPLCDKLTYLPPLFGFAYLGIISIDFVWLFVLIEFLGQFVARKFLEALEFSIAANNFGKIKAIICFALVIYCAMLHANPDFFQIGNNILVICIIFGLASIAFKFIPNRLYADILSTSNFCCGVVSLVLTSQHHFVWSVIAIMTGQFFDLFDGRMAEKHGGTRFGPYLDDIADFLSFGICPAYILFELGGEYNWFYVPCFVFGVGYRLVRFVMTDKHRVDLPKGVFNGLPSPAGAINVISAFLISRNDSVLWFATTISIVLMASEIRFAHFGKVILREVPKPIFILGSAAMMLLLAHIVRVRQPEMFGWFLLACVTIYMIVGRIMAIKKQKIFSANQQSV